MKKTLRNLFTIGLLLFGITIFGQEYGFDIHNTSLKEYIQMEEGLGSERIATNSNHISFSGNAQPIKFQRTEKVIPDLITYLHFKEKDSIMSKVLYEWDLRHFGEDGEKQSKRFQKKLIRKFKKLERQITKLYGEPKSKGNLSEIKLASLKGGLNRNCKWYPDNKTEIEMYIVASNYYEKKGMITIKPTHRIRLYIRKLN